MKAMLFAAFVAMSVSLAACQMQPKTETELAETIAEGTNRAFFHEVTTSAPQAEVWRLWTDVSTWKLWDKGLKDAEINGPFVVGAKGKIIPLSGSSADFTVTEYVEGETYAFETKLPLATLTVRRSFIGEDPTRFRHDVSFEGFLGGFWAGRFGPGFRKALPPTMDEIARLAEAAPAP